MGGFDPDLTALEVPVRSFGVRFDVRPANHHLAVAAQGHGRFPAPEQNLVPSLDADAPSVDVGLDHTSPTWGGARER